MVIEQVPHILSPVVSSYALKLFFSKAAPVATIFRDTTLKNCVLFLKPRIKALVLSCSTIPRRAKKLNRLFFLLVIFLFLGSFLIPNQPFRPIRNSIPDNQEDLGLSFFFFRVLAFSLSLSLSLSAVQKA